MFKWTMECNNKKISRLPMEAQEIFNIYRITLCFSREWNNGNIRFVIALLFEFHCTINQSK